MMRTLMMLSILTPCLAACATLPPTERTPFLPPGVYGVYQDNDIGAINQSAWAFASPANTSGNPIEAARAVVALEYLPGELKENPRWAAMDRGIKVRMGQARDQLRQILGIRPEAPPQFVVNALLALSWDLQAGDQAAAMEVLTSPIFTQPPTSTLRTLSNLPYVQVANLATSRAGNQSFPSGGPRG